MNFNQQYIQAQIGQPESNNNKPQKLIHMQLLVNDGCSDGSGLPSGKFANLVSGQPTIK